MKINLTKIDNCQLNCHFCMQSQNIPYEKQTFTIERFKDVIEKAISQGYDEIDLRPNMGDIFDDHDITERLDWLYDHPKIKLYSFATHLLGLSSVDMWHVVDAGNKLWMDVSIYGWDKESYKTQTNVDRFDDWLLNFKQLITIAKSSVWANPLCSVNLYMRAGYTYDDFPESELKGLMEEAVRMGAMIENDEVSNLNWGGKIAQGKESYNKKGICVHLVIHNGIYPDGDMTMCACWDTHKDMVFANIDTDENVFTKQYWKYITSHLSGKYFGMCENCNDFSAASPEDFDGYPHMEKVKRFL